MAKTIYVDWAESSLYPHSKELQRLLPNESVWETLADIEGTTGHYVDNLPEDFDTGTVKYRVRVTSILFGVITEQTSSVKQIGV